MGNRIKFAAFGLAAMILGTQANSQDGYDASTVLATVNGDEITVGNMILMREALPDQYNDYPDDLLFEALYNQLVEQSLIASSVTGPTPARVTFGVENEKRDLLTNVAVGRLFEQEVTDEAIQAVYDSAFSGVIEDLEYNASHILLETEDEAIALVETLQSGADFADAAKEHSTGPSGPSGGSLGWFPRGAMVGPFDEAVASMDVGSLSAPVETQFGWHIIKLNETRPMPAPPLEEVREDIADQIGSNAIDALIARLTSNADIVDLVPDDLDPAILKDLSLLEN
ncbi:MAG: peptidylprolyl isomerase [Paracoccaceae bacterium]|jgi:peptidyl-prolyl cis-trans isomerase C|nr:peptidylprolyl isomerase [Paracoccaceae bacterium]